MRMPLGLFGTSARSGQKERAAIIDAAATPNPSPTRSYLGGLVSYQRPQGQTGSDRLQIASGMLSDLGASLDGRQGGNVAAIQRDALARQAAQQAADLKKSFEASIKDPQELAFYRAAPAAYLAAKAKAFEPISVTGGNTVLNGPKGTFTAPKLVEDAGVYGTQGTDGYTQTGARGASIAETEAERSHRVSEQIDRIRAAVAEGQLTVQQGQLHLDQLKHKARVAAGGYGTAGVGQVIGPNLDLNDWELQ
jgi:hypothetical protein